MHRLIDFLTNKMSMTDLYQPAVIKELLLHKGQRTKAQLAASLAQYDLSVQEYYERIVMRWPKITLTKHGIIDYERQGALFHLRDFPEDAEAQVEALRICEEKIAQWREMKRSKEKAPEAGASVRYEVLKAAGSKCQLCGIPAALRPIDVDHIIPRSKANKHGKVCKDGSWIDIHDPENLQALCFSCNRAKRATDDTDFRTKGKLVRDGIPAMIEAEGRSPNIRQLKGQALLSALYEKLVEEHAEFITAEKPEQKLEELADMVEVVFALAERLGADESALMAIRGRKRHDRGGFAEGHFYAGETAAQRS